MHRRGCVNRRFWPPAVAPAFTTVAARPWPDSRRSFPLRRSVYGGQGTFLVALPTADSLIADQVRRGHDGRLDAAHLDRTLDRLTDAFLGERVAGLHLRPRVAVSRPVEHRDAQGDVVCGERPATEHHYILRAYPVPVRLDRAGVRELAHLDVGPAVAQH